MEHERDAHRLERAAGEFRAAGAGGGRQVPAVDVREVHARALEYGPVLDHLRDSAAAFGPRPFVTPEGAPIDPAQARDDRLLQSGQKLLDGVDVHGEG